MLHARLTKSWDRLIHIAVHSKCIYFIKELVEYGTVEDLAIENLNKDTGLSIAAVSGMVEIAKLMIEKNNKLTMKRGTRELIPFGMAAEVGHKEMAEYLYSKTEFDCLDHSESIRLFFITLSSNLYGITSFLRAPKFVTCQSGYITDYILFLIMLCISKLKYISYIFQYFVELLDFVL